VWTSTAPAAAQEIVSEPDLTSADMALRISQPLKEHLVYGGVSDCDMEKGMGALRRDVSVRPPGAAKELAPRLKSRTMNSSPAYAARWNMKSRARSKCCPRAAS